jgi:hypothetical protein
MPYNQKAMKVKILDYDGPTGMYVATGKDMPGVPSSRRLAILLVPRNSSAGLTTPLSAPRLHAAEQ